MTAAITVDHVWKKFRRYHERSQTIKERALGRKNRYDEFWALKDVSFELQPGDTMGIVGANGQGKSTLLKTIAKILVPESGSVTTNGKMSALLEIGTGFHPELTGRENVFLSRSLYGESDAESRRRFDEIVDFSGVEEFIDFPIKNYSSGMQARLAFATAISIDPEILLIDEVLAVGDEEFQRKCAERLKEFQANGCTIVLVSHGLASIQSLCTRSIWIHEHRLAADGPSADVIWKYLDEVETRAAEAIEAQRTELDLTQLKFTNINYGSPTGQGRFDFGDPLDISFDVETTERVENVALSFNIAPAGAPDKAVFAYNSREEQRFFTLEGRQTFRFRAPVISLGPDTYLLSIGVFSPDHSRFLDLNPHRFRLVIEPTARNIGESGPVQFGGAWTLEETDSQTKLVTHERHAG